MGRSLVTLLIIVVLAIAALFMLSKDGEEDLKERKSNPQNQSEDEEPEENYDLSEEEKSEEDENFSASQDNERLLPDEIDKIIAVPEKLINAAEDYKKAKIEEEKLIEDQSATLKDIHEVIVGVDKAKDNLEDEISDLEPETKEELKSLGGDKEEESSESDEKEDVEAKKSEASKKQESGTIESRGSDKKPEQQQSAIKTDQLTNRNILEEFNFKGP
ncbi:MAG: hypothetical protein R3A13_02010 [Bdellovibrionota bacterium]